MPDRSDPRRRPPAARGAHRAPHGRAAHRPGRPAAARRASPSRGGRRDDHARPPPVLRPAAAGQRLLRRRRVRARLGTSHPDRAAGRGRLAVGADHAAGDGEHLARDRGQPARHHRLLAGARCGRPSPTIAHLHRARAARAQRARLVRPPDRVRDRAVDRRLPARRDGRDGPEEHRPRRPGPGRAGPRPAGVGHRHGAAPGHRRDQRDRAAASCALVGVEPARRGELDVHPRGGRGPGRGVPRRGPARGGRVRPAGRGARLHREDGRRRC